MLTTLKVAVATVLAASVVGAGVTLKVAMSGDSSGDSTSLPRSGATFADLARSSVSGLPVDRTPESERGLGDDDSRVGASGARDDEGITPPDDRGNDGRDPSDDPSRHPEPWSDHGGGDGDSGRDENSGRGNDDDADDSDDQDRTGGGDHSGDGGENDSDDHSGEGHGGDGDGGGDDGRDD